ncbi:hypothetical protein QQF64_014269 [Cirrhinus molitorella]|uniref:Thioredoxin domain-containing protein n=1 Tax=Cirrhinus molitorella TaxID=172907 RepID=A0ABR3NRW2_9TELE
MVEPIPCKAEQVEQTASRVETAEPIPSKAEQSASRAEPAEQTASRVELIPSKVEQVGQTASRVETAEPIPSKAEQSASRAEQTASRVELIPSKVEQVGQTASRVETAELIPSKMEQGEQSASRAEQRASRGGAGRAAAHQGGADWTGALQGGTEAQDPQIAEGLCGQIGTSWGVLFSHPRDFTPVCTTELGRAAQLSLEFSKRNVKLIALSVDGLEEHHDWSKDIMAYNNAEPGSEFPFPIIADDRQELVEELGMLDPEEKNRSRMPLSARCVSAGKSFWLFFFNMGSVNMNM